MPELRVIDNTESHRPAIGELIAEIVRRPGEPFKEAAIELLKDAVIRRASDIHIEPHMAELRIRYRIDGMLAKVASLDKELHQRLAACIKVMARITVYHKDHPQDGRIQGEDFGCPRELRVSTFPTIYGEKLVIRILDERMKLPDVDELGFDDEIARALRRFTSRKEGCLLLTGPSSSGKSTTIYSLLKRILEKEGDASHVVTVEDPVEYRLDGIAQSQINDPAGFTFPAALRSVLRQDPEVIMVGEVRDTETAHIAIQAGLTGHLVLTTIHAGSSAGVFTRLIDMGVQPFLIASAVNAVLNQRLLRKVCPGCSAGRVPSPALLEATGAPDTDDYRQGAGCEKCSGIGYAGRTAVGEMLIVDVAVRDTILAGETTEHIAEKARFTNNRRLLEAAVEKAAEGATTLEEVLRIIPAREDNEM
ncbi:GspE/PulE family protein [Candidatus Hydrogenedentota bacterium]